MTSHNLRRWIFYSLTLLGILLVILCVLLIRDYESLRRQQIITARETWLSALFKQRGPVTVSDVTAIRSWMTFDYINKLFELPADYLKTQLQISDPHYPQVSLSSYAKQNGLDTTTFTTDVETAVHNYLTNASST